LTGGKKHRFAIKAENIAVNQGLVRGRTYRIKYRTLNEVGYSDYSHLLYTTAANVPGAPKSPG